MHLPYLGPLLVLNSILQLLVNSAEGKPSGAFDAEYRRKAIAIERRSVLTERQASDPKDFSWIRKWAAIGDSFTAGIGAGHNYVSSDKPADVKCSRYDESYPAVLERQFGSAAGDFYFKACSGDRTGPIYEQAYGLPTNMDFVTLTAGGNDLCLSDILKRCILLPSNEATCSSYIAIAQGNINNILENNIKEVLMALNSRMKRDEGIVVVNSYAEYFNTEDDECSNKRVWGFVGGSLPLTTARRILFNNLVRDANEKIKDAVEWISNNDNIDYKIGFADWSLYPKKVHGQFCEKGSSGAYPDPKVPNLQFFKKDTRPGVFQGELPFRRRSLPNDGDESIEDEEHEKFMQSLWKSKLWNSPSPAAMAMARLNKREILAANCPSNSGNSWIPDEIGKLFHPNQEGHKAIASFAMTKMMSLRAEVINQDFPMCGVTRPPDFYCNNEDSRNKNSYANVDRLVRSSTAYCVEVEEWLNSWSEEFSTEPFNRSKVFDVGTPDEHTLRIDKTDNQRTFTRQECQSAFRRIIHGCDGDMGAENPLNFKFGGVENRNGVKYTITINSFIRPDLENFKKGLYGSCECRNKGSWMEFTLMGAGWASFDKGEQTIIRNVKGLFGNGYGKSEFTYLRDPKLRKDGMEWKYDFRGQISNKQFAWQTFMLWFDSDEIQKASGGSTGGCKMV